MAHNEPVILVVSDRESETDSYADLTETEMYESVETNHVANIVACICESEDKKCF